jgi:hypothetical protein
MLMAIELDELLLHQGPMSLAGALFWLAPAAHALDALHARALSHGAVRGENVVCGDDSGVRLAPGPGGTVEQDRRAFARLAFQCLGGEVTAGDAPAALRWKTESEPVGAEVEAMFARAFDAGREPPSASEIVRVLRRAAEREATSVRVEPRG